MPHRYSQKRFFLFRSAFLWKLAFTVLLTFLLNPPLSGDELYFKSGYSRTAVVIRELEDSITFKTEMGISTISRDQIDFVEKATREENQELLKKWREKERKLKEAQEASREAERKFREAQIAKGLIEFEGKWMTPQEKEEILDLRRRAREHRRQFDAQQEAKGLVRFQHLWMAPENAAELRRLEPEIHNLYDSITGQRQLVDSLRAAMANVATLDEAEKFSQRIKEIKRDIEVDTQKLGRLLKKADEVEAVSVRYEVPEEFRDAFASDADEQ